MDYIIPSDCQISEINRLYKQIFGYKTNGIFFEIGGFDGECASLTCFLADLGWKGFYIEPVSEYAFHCLRRHRHNDVEVINVAVGPSGQTIANISIAEALSSMAPQHIEAFKKQTWGKNMHQGNIRTVQVVTPNFLLSHWKLKKIDLMVIDTEGYEWPIISSMDFNKWRPTALIVELRDQSPSFGKQIQEESMNVIKKLRDNNYIIFWRDNCNVIFVDQLYRKELIK